MALSKLKAVPLHRGAKVWCGVSLAASLVYLGWVLALYQMPIWAWVITLLCLLHLSIRGRAALPLALTWINGVVWVAAFRFAAPAGFVWRNARYWSASLIFLWVMATIIAFAIAKVPNLYRFPRNPAFSGLIAAGLLICGLGLGGVLYHQGLSPQ